MADKDCAGCLALLNGECVADECKGNLNILARINNTAEKRAELYNITAEMFAELFKEEQNS